MQRRTFIKNTAKSGLALSLSGSMASQLLNFYTTEGITPFFKLSLAQWSLHKAILESRTLPALDFAKKASDMGFNAAEYVSQLYPLGTGNHNEAIKKLVRDLNVRSKDNGITNVLIMVDDEGELAALTKKDRDDAIAKHTKWIDAAAGLGCHSIRVNLFGTGAENDFNVWKDTAADGLGRLAEYAAINKISVIVENHGGLSSDAAMLTDVIRTVNLPNCGTLPDFGNFCTKREGGERWGAPCIEEYDRYKGVAELMPYAFGVSAKSYDFDATGNETTINYRKMLDIVKKAGYTGHIGIEYEGNRLSEEEGIKATRALLLKAAQEI